MSILNYWTIEFGRMHGYKFVWLFFVIGACYSSAQNEFSFMLSNKRTQRGNRAGSYLLTCDPKSRNSLFCSKIHSKQDAKASSIGFTFKLSLHSCELQTTSTGEFKEKLKFVKKLFLKVVRVAQCG